jgi:sugar lactone lactonase YvrE
MWKKLAALFVFAWPVLGQTYTINTIAGNGPTIANLNTLTYALRNPQGVAVDSAGNYYIALQDWCRVWVVNSSGILTQTIGTGHCGYSGDNGLASSAALNAPRGVAVDSNGANIYIADTANEVIRKVTVSTGTITTIAGNGTYGYSGEGVATSVELAHPSGVSVDTSGNVYIADTENCRVRKLTGTTISTFAGTSQMCGYNADNIQANAAYLFSPLGVFVDGTASNVYIADTRNHRIRKVSISTGVITTVAGNGTAGYGEGAANGAVISSPAGVVADNAGNFYIADTGNSRVRQVLNGTISSLASGFATQGITLSGGNIYVADTSDNRIAKIAGGVTTVVGNGSNAGGDNGPAISALFGEPCTIAMDAGGEIFIADRNENVIRKISGGNITTVAGSGACNANIGDGGNPLSASLCTPWGVAVNSAGTVIYIADTYNHRIRKVANGIISTVAGTGTAGYNGDGIMATAATLYLPSSVALDPSGNLYIADTDNCAIREVIGTTISTVAGVPASGCPSTSQSQYYNGEGVATSAFLYGPMSVFVDSTGNNVYIADTYNSRIRKVTNGVISTVAGTGTAGYNGDGMATSVQLDLPFTAILDSANNMYIADSQNFRIRKVTGTALTTIGGNGGSGFSGDGGTATSAQISGPWGLAVDSNLNLFVADTGNQRIRELTAPITCMYSLSFSSASAIAAQSSGSFMVLASPSTCTWTATANPGILTVTNGSPGMGNGTVSYNVAPNGLAGEQIGSITVTGMNFSQNFTVTQAGQGCLVGFTPASASLGSGALSTSVSMALSGSDCKWSASSSLPAPSWITVNTMSGSGPGPISYSVSSNASSSAARSGAINVNVTTTGTQAAFNINQAGALCVYSLAQSNQSFSFGGGPGSVSVAAPGGCGWTASSNVPWITSVTIAGGVGTGSGSVSFNVQSNPSSVARTGSVTIAGQSFAVTQSGTLTPSSCTISVPPLPGVANVALEGRTEVVGDLLVTCSGLSSAITGNFLLTLNTSITNQVTPGTNTAVDALLCAGSAPCVSGVATNQYGQVVGYNAMSWPAVTLTPSGGIASVRITNVRADASFLANAANLQAVMITGQLSVTSASAFPVPNTVQTLATAAPTLSFQVGPPTGGTQSIYQLAYQELTMTSFHTASGSTPATRLRMVVSGLPAGVTAFAPIYPAGGPSQGQLYMTDCSGGNLGSPLTGVAMAGGTYYPNPVTEATWLVLSASSSSIDTLTFPLLLSNPGNADVSHVQITGSYGPASPVGGSCGDPSAKVVPRYRDFSVTPQSLASFRLTTSVTATRTLGSVPAKGKVEEKGRRVGAITKANVKEHPLDSTSGTQVNFMNNLTNESTYQPVTNAVVNGSVQSGNNVLQFIVSPMGSGSCNQGGGGQYTCTFPSIAPGTSVSCSGFGQEDSSYSGDSVTNSAQVSSDQSPADLSAVVSSSTFVVTGPTMQIEVVTPVVTTGQTVTISGWAVDQFTPISSVQIMVDNNVVGNANYGGTLTPQNPNICNEYSTWVGCPYIGFSYALDPSCPNPTACVALTPGPHTITAVAMNSVVPPASQGYTPATPLTVTVNTIMPGTKVGVFRANVAFLEDSNGNRAYDAGVDTYFPNFTGPGGYRAGDYPVAGDWTGDGHTKVGIYRSTTGQWFLDANNNGTLDAGDFTYGYGGIVGDVPVTGDWLGTGKTCIGIFRSGFLWVLDSNCNGSFDAPDAVFPFGGISGDVPVVGAWTGGTTKVGVVRKYAPAGVPIGNPFYWVVDAGAANAGASPANHPPDCPQRCFAFGGLTGDVFVTGDWFNTGTSGAGVFRNGFWVLDTALPSDPQANHSLPPLAFGFGGAPGDLPVVGKW